VSAAMSNTARPRLLDLYCKAGGASMGYHRAGFEVVGVDVEPQIHYPFEFHQADALTFLADRGHEFDVIAASPPCHDHSALRHTMGPLHGTGWLVAATRQGLRVAGRPYVIENVPGSPLDSPIVLCGSMFGLGAKCRDGWRRLERHRLFESNVPLLAPGPCVHQGPAVGVYGGGPSPRTEKTSRGGYQGLMLERVVAMGIDWMTRDELSQAIPPAYTEHIGAQLIAQLKDRTEG
jgi:DNA (cytosine-5)-methyltransferase 1